PAADMGGGGRQNHAKDVGGFRAEGHADAEFVRPRGDAIGNHAVESDGCERQSKNREDPEQCDHKALLGVLAKISDPSAEVADLHGLLLAINFDELGADVAENLKRSGASADQNLGEHAQTKRVGDKDGGLDGISQAVVAGVSDDADDLQPAVAAG